MAAFALCIGWERYKAACLVGSHARLHLHQHPPLEAGGNCKILESLLLQWRWFHRALSTPKRSVPRSQPCQLGIRHTSCASATTIRPVQEVRKVFHRKFDCIQHR